MGHHLCTYSEPLSPDEPRKRRCRDCGEPQVYRPPTGHGEFPYVMMMKKDDLRHLLSYVEDAFDEHGCDPANDEVIVRVRELLD